MYSNSTIQIFTVSYYYILQGYGTIKGKWKTSTKPPEQDENTEDRSNNDLLETVCIIVLLTWSSNLIKQTYSNNLDSSPKQDTEAKFGLVY